ncbi:hypothetical protein ACX3O0_06975 [Homoserinimonas sp. A447]
MNLVAAIAPKLHEPDGTREMREIPSVGADYDSAKAGLDSQVPEGWLLLYIRQA